MRDGADTDGAAETRTHAFGPNTMLGWGQLVMGWICAQSMLTLLPIAPPGWGSWFLIVTGGAFALWAAAGLSLALRKRPMLEIGPDGLDLPGGRVPWDAVDGYQIDAAGRRIVLRVSDRRAGRAMMPAVPRTLDCLGLWPGRASPGLNARPIDARLTEIARAFRDIRPDLEDAG